MNDPIEDDVACAIWVNIVAEPESSYGGTV